MTHLENLELEQITFTEVNQHNNYVLPDNLLDKVMTHNIVLLRVAKEAEIAQKELDYEKAVKRPDVALKANYDRGGNVMQNFTGFGLSMDLPLWNRNKGNIKIAQTIKERKDSESESLKWILENNLKKHILKIRQYESVLNGNIFNKMDEQLEMLENYRKHLTHQQITLIEFIDFASALKETIDKYQDIRYDYQVEIEELKYLVGEEL